MANTAKRIGTDELAALFRTTRQTIHRWTQAGMPHRMDKGAARYVVAECIAWRIDAVREEERAKHKRDEPEGNAEMRKTAAEASLKELELARRRDELVPKVDVVEEVEHFVGGFVTVVTGELQRFERDIVQAETPAAARAVTQQIQDALMRGAQRYADTVDHRDEAAA